MDLRKNLPRQCSFDAPAARQTVDDRASGNACDLGPRQCGFSSAIECHRAHVRLYFRTQRPFEWPAVAESVVQSCWSDAKDFGPFNDCECHSIVRHSVIGPGVPALLPPRYPAAIAWFVTAHVVNAVKRGVRWSRAHISQEVRERVPSLAHRNPATSVEFVACRSRFIAPLHHAFPTCLGLVGVSLGNFIRG